MIKQQVVTSLLGISFFILITLPAIALAEVSDKAIAVTGSQQAIKGSLADVPSAREIIQRCGYKNPGLDQQGKFSVLLRNKKGDVKRSQYLRLWKNYDGKDGIANKMLLFSEFPPEAKGAAFLRVEYASGTAQDADQWIYLPVLRKIRRVSIRDPRDSFLNSDLTYADVSERDIDDDTHTSLGIKMIKDLQFYVVESVGKGDQSFYGKRIQWFLKTDDWQDCSVIRIDYFNTRGVLIKEQFLKWQVVGGAWVWDRVLVRNRVSGHSSIFQFTEVVVNSGLKDSLFSERTLRLGPGSIARQSN